MERIMDSKFQKTTIYEIFRACRLCGAGGGYKMPIIQSVVNIESEIDLKHKIKECVQIEVHHDDRMPPLICELCVDKVNDFYEFLDMCRQTNKRTRQRLGLPMHTQSVGTTDSEDCILGVTEQVYTKEDSNESNPRSQKKKHEHLRGVKVKKESELRVRLECIDDQVLMVKRKMNNSPKCRSSPKRGRSPKRRDSPKRRSSPKIGRSSSSDSGAPAPRALRNSVREEQTRKEENKSLRAGPRGILKKESNDYEPSRSKRLREPDSTSVVPLKKVKLKTVSPPPSPSLKCRICSHTFKNQAGLSNHVKIHAPTFTKPECACNACGWWGASAEDARAHHAQHAPYRCNHCRKRFSTHQHFNNHYVKKICSPWAGVPDEVCAKCSRQFATRKLLDQHDCHERRLKCPKCHRTFTLTHNLKRHQKVCSVRKKRELVVEAALLRQLRPLQVRVARCDPLLRFTVGDHYDVSTVIEEFGLDEKCVYPYIYTARYRVKREPFMYDSMVNIKGELDFDDDEKFIHWDSDSESEAESVSLISNLKEVPNLSTLALKTIFSYKLLGKVPRKRRKIKIEKDSFYDSILGNTDADTTIRNNIDNIIDNLSEDQDTGASQTDVEDDKIDSDSLTTKTALNTSADDDLFPANDDKKITNDDFDDVFNKHEKDYDKKIVDQNEENYVEKVRDRETESFGKEESVNDTSRVNVNEQLNVTNNTSQNTSSEKMDVSEDFTNEDAVSKSVKVTNDKSYTFNDSIGLTGNVDITKTESDVGLSMLDNENKVNAESKINYDTNESSEKRENELNGKSEKTSCKLYKNDLESESDIEDRKLLDAIDAQIGENTKCDGDRISDANTKSMDLDSISDEGFNFDS